MEARHALVHTRMAAVVAVCAAAITNAEPPATAEAPQPPAAPVTEIVVTGERPNVETAIDRKIYAVSRDLQATSGSAADVLRNLPSVTVDLDGNPSLRGDASVTILIDGRLAPEFNNSSRGEALQQLGAENIDRIEVLTNPPANFKRDGAAGIINIITRRSTGARSASAQASLGSSGRYSVGGRQGVQSGKWNLRGSASLRHDRRKRDIRDDRVTFDDAGAVVDDRHVHAVGDDDRLAKNATLGADLDMTSVDRLSAEGSFYRRDADSSVIEYARTLGAGGAATSEYTRSRVDEPYEYSSGAQLRYHHAGERDGDGLTVNAERSESRETGKIRYAKKFATPSLPDELQRQQYLDNQVTREFSADYVKSQAEDRKLVTGYDLTQDNYLEDIAQTLIANPGQPLPLDPNFTNTFRYDKTVHAVYGSYELPFGKWKTLAGLRLENAEFDIDQVTTGEHFNPSYFGVYPSLHVSRELDERHTLTISYSRRVFQPDGQDLNPFRVQVNEFAVRAGNPHLRPVEIDLVEAGWSFNEGRTSRELALYARRSSNSRTIVTTLISPTVTLATPYNLGESLSGGLEFSMAARLGERVDYNLSGNVFYNQIDAANLGFSGRRSTYTADVKAAINWRMSEKDTLQVNAASLGRRVTPQGHRPGNATLDLGYRHQFRPNLSVTATVTDVFASKKAVNVVDTPELQETNTFRPPSRVVLVGVSWSLAGAKKQPEKFEYEQ